MEKDLELTVWWNVWDFLELGFLNWGNCIIIRNSNSIFFMLKKKNSRSLFRNKRFMLDEMFHRNASKFGIFLEFENPFSFFLSFHFVEQGIYWGKNNVVRNEKWKKICGFSYSKKYGKFWNFLLGHFIKHKYLIFEECANIT